MIQPAVIIHAEHAHLGRGVLMFYGVTESTDGSFTGDDPAVYALLPAGMPEVYESAIFLDQRDRVYRVNTDLFAYGYERCALWISFLDSRDDDDPLVFRLLDLGKAAA